MEFRGIVDLWKQVKHVLYEPRLMDLWFVLVPQNIVQNKLFTVYFVNKKNESKS